MKATTMKGKWLPIITGLFSGLLLAGNLAQAATIICAQAGEGSVAKIQCPSGQVVKTLQYASYGTPLGSCNSFQTYGCHAGNSGPIVNQACLGKSSCQVGANNSTFGDPCYGVGKRLAIQVICDAGSSPSPTPSSGNVPFYGMNGHISWNDVVLGQNFSTQVSQLQSLGAKIYRNDVRDQNNATNMLKFINLAAPAGIQVYPVLIVDVGASSSESDAYNRGLNLGKIASSTLKGFVKYYEVGNEYDSFAYTNGDGNNNDQYDTRKFQIARGAIRGMIAGVKANDSSAKIIMSPSSWLHFAFNQMLASGTQPDGGSGYPKIDWDITAWHWYSDMGNIESATGGSGRYNVAQKLKDIGKPVWFTEFGVRAEVGNNQQQANYLIGNLMLGQFASIASKYNIQSVQMYELYDDAVYGGDGNYGLISSDGKTLKPQFTAVQNFIRNNPK